VELGEFTYHRPNSLAEACELGRIHGNKARYLAGGTELLVDLRQKRDAAEHLIALRGIDALKQIRVDGEALHLGALVTLSEITESPEVREVFPALRETALKMGGVQIRSQGTIGGNFSRAVPCADTPPICIAGEAQVRLVRGESERTLAAETFFVGARETVLERGEVLAEIVIPRQPAASGASYQRFSLRRGSALAVAAVAARVVLDGGKISDARLVLGAVAPVPLSVEEAAGSLMGQVPSAELLAAAAKMAAASAEPISDLRGSDAFRRDLVAVLTVRALREAISRAGGTLP
jgi:carbon-monoxide dehydrogenase medium subunit